MTNWEQRLREIEQERRAGRWARIVIAIVALLLLAGGLAWDQYAYGDWKCLFMECRKVEVVK